MSLADTVENLEQENKHLAALVRLYECNPLRIRYIKLTRFEDVTGYTQIAIQTKKKTGKWMEGVHILKAPDGKLVVDLDAYEAWCRGELDPTDIEACKKWQKNTNA